MNNYNEINNNNNNEIKEKQEEVSDVETARNIAAKLFINKK